MSGFYRIRNLLRDYTPHDPGSPAAVFVDQLDVPLGGIIAVIGGSGSGKTTLLNLISGLEQADQPDNGKRQLELCLPGESAVRFLGGRLKQSRSKEAFPHDRVSYVFQQGYLLNHASLKLNLAMTRRAAGLRADNESLNQLLELAQLNSVEEGSLKKLSDRAITLSGGQQQRVNIARAVGREPALLFADELTSSLDPDTAREVLSQLRKWIWRDTDTTTISSYKDGRPTRLGLDRCMIWVTHDYQLASEFADAIIVMSRGQLAAGCTRPIEFDLQHERPKAADMLSWVQSGVVESEVVQSEVLNAEELSGDDSLHEDHHSLLQHNPDSAGKSTSNSAITSTQAAIGNLGSGIRLAVMDSYRQPEASKSSAINFFKSIFRPLTGYANWVRSLQLAAILGLIMLVTYGQTEVIAFFDEQLEDPDLRHVIVSQNMREPDSSIVNPQSLLTLEASIASLGSTLQKTQEGVETKRTAFGRFTEYLSAYPEGLDEINDTFVAEISVGILDPEEPAYTNLAVHVIDENNPSCENNRISTPGELIKYDDELVVILSRRYLQDTQNMFEANLCEHPFIDFWDRDTKTFRIAGFVEQPPADGYDNFDALMQTDIWRTWYSGMGKRYKRNLSRAAVYFTRKNHDGVIDKLFERAFAFDQEIINKFKTLLGTAGQLRNTFLVLTWLTLLVAITVAAGLIWSYLVNNAKSIAVLRAHNAWFWPLVSAIPFQLMLAYAYALLYLFIAALFWNFLVSQPAIVYWLTSLTSGDWIPSELRWHHVRSTLPWLGFSLFIMILVGWGCLLIWRVTHRKLAHELRQAY